MQTLINVTDDAYPAWCEDDDLLKSAAIAARDRKRYGTNLPLPDADTLDARADRLEGPDADYPQAAMHVHRLREFARTIRAGGYYETLGGAATKALQDASGNKARAKAEHRNARALLKMRVELWRREGSSPRRYASPSSPCPRLVRRSQSSGRPKARGASCTARSSGDPDPGDPEPARGRLETFAGVVV